MATESTPELLSSANTLVPELCALCAALELADTYFWQMRSLKPAEKSVGASSPAVKRLIARVRSLPQDPLEAHGDSILFVKGCLHLTRSLSEPAAVLALQNTTPQSRDRAGELMPWLQERREQSYREILCALAEETQNVFSSMRLSYEDEWPNHLLDILAAHCAALTAFAGRLQALGTED